MVLGDEPLGTTWLPDPDRRGGVIVRWRYGPDEPTASAALAGSPDAGWDEVPFSLSLPSGQAEILDSADFGEGEHAALALVLVPGEYRLATAEYAPTNDIALLLHRLNRIDAAT